MWCIFMLAVEVFPKKYFLPNVNNSHSLQRKRGEPALSNGCHRKASHSRIRRHLRAVDALIGHEYHAQINDAL